MKSNLLKQLNMHVNKEVAVEYVVVWAVSLVGGIFIGMAL